MKGRRFLFAGALIAVGCGFFAMHCRERTEYARRRIEVLQREEVAAKAAQARLARRLKAARAGATANTKGPERRTGGGVNWLEKLRSDPAVQNRFIAYEKSGLGMKYAPLFKELGLTPEQIARCEDNLSKRDALYMDLDEALRVQGIKGGPAAAKLSEQMLAGYTADQVALLGPAGAQKLSDYETTFVSTAMLNAMAGGATAAGVPLTTYQLQQLSAAAVASAKSAAAAQPDGVDWATVDTQAAGLLTPAQLNLLQNADFIGPFGMGSRFQSRLNYLITQADQADRTSVTSAGN